MYRRVVLSTPESLSGTINILYHVRGGVLLSQHRSGLSGYDSSIGAVQLSSAVVFDDVVRLQTTASIAKNRTYEFILNVSENQPGEETVEEVTTTGVEISVYNDHGVLVCRNDVKTPARSDLTQTVVPGEELGEMTGETTPEPGEMESEPVDDTGAMN